MKSAAHQYEDKLLEFAYGELPQHEADAVDAHVRGCARCSQALTEIRGVRSTMASMPLLEAPDAGLDSLLAYAEQAAKRSAQSRAPAPLWKRWLTPLASVMALVTVGVIAFRANQEFDTSPASALADKKVEERSKSQAEAQAPQAQPLQEAQAPAPVLAAAAEPKDTLKAEGKLEARKQDLDAQLPDRWDQGSKRGSVQQEAKPTAAPQSVTRRSNLAKNAPEEEAYRQDDFSNATGKGARVKDSAPPPPPASPAPVEDKVGFGLGSSLGGSTRNLDTVPADSAARPAPRRESAADDRGGARSEAVQAPSAPAPQKKAKSSYSLKELGRGSNPGAAEADEPELESTDSLSTNRDAKFAERQRASLRTQALESARVASNRGDRLGEIRLLAQVLQNGATGYERVEALKRLCDAYEALGEYDRADPFCDQLLTEFPNTVAAKVVSDRRNRVQRAPAPKSAAPSSMDRERKAADELEAPRPAESQPAQSY